MRHYRSSAWKRPSAAPGNSKAAEAAPSEIKPMFAKTMSALDHIVMGFAILLAASPVLAIAGSAAIG